MYLETVYGIIDKEGLWIVMRLYEMDERLLNGVISFHVDSRAKVRM